MQDFIKDEKMGRGGVVRSLHPWVMGMSAIINNANNNPGHSIPLRRNWGVCPWERGNLLKLC